MSTDLFIECLYSPFNSYGIYGDVSSFISDSSTSWFLKKGPAFLVSTGPSKLYVNP